MRGFVYLMIRCVVLVEANMFLQAHQEHYACQDYFDQLVVSKKCFASGRGRHSPTHR
jgi:hypothetical protein